MRRGDGCRGRLVLLVLLLSGLVTGGTGLANSIESEAAACAALTGTDGDVVVTASHVVIPDPEWIPVTDSFYRPVPVTTPCRITGLRASIIHARRSACRRPASRRSTTNNAASQNRFCIALVPSSVNGAASRNAPGS